MRKIITGIGILFIISCELPPRQQNETVLKPLQTLGDTVSANEEYVMITTAVNMPMYVNHDQAAFTRWGKRMGVKTSILGPAKWDVNAQINIIEDRKSVV